MMVLYGQLNWGPLKKGEIADRRRLSEVIKRYNPMAIMHFAAYTYVGEYVEDPGKYYRNNVVRILNLLKAASPRWQTSSNS